MENKKLQEELTATYSELTNVIPLEWSMTEDSPTATYADMETVSVSDCDTEELIDNETEKEYSHNSHDNEQAYIKNASGVTMEPMPSTSSNISRINASSAGHESCASYLGAGSFATCKNPHKVVLKGWTKEEKYHLYMGIKYLGSTKIQKIKQTIPAKTEKEIREAINYYKNRANNNPECTLRKIKVRKIKTKPLIPLATWAKILNDNFTFSELQTDIINAFRLIADLEQMPPSVCTEMIDFPQIYHHIADAMEGKALTENRLYTKVLNSCVLDTALVSRPFMKLSALKHIINSINFRDQELPVFPRPTQDNELAIIRHLAVLRNYNPLCITEEHLRPSTCKLPVKENN